MTLKQAEKAAAELDRALNAAEADYERARDAAQAEHDRACNAARAAFERARGERAEEKREKNMEKNMETVLCEKIVAALDAAGVGEYVDNDVYSDDDETTIFAEAGEGVGGISLPKKNLAAFLICVNKIQPAASGDQEYERVMYELAAAAEDCGGKYSA